MKSNLIKSITEAKDVSLYQKLLAVLNEYTKAYPATGVDVLLRKIIEKGKKCMPKDKVALNILSDVLGESASASAVQKLLNMRFANLQEELCPKFKNGKRIETAFWHVSDTINDKVVSLINVDSIAAGRWSDMYGKRVTLL